MAVATFSILWSSTKRESIQENNDFFLCKKHEWSITYAGKRAKSVPPHTVRQWWWHRVTQMEGSMFKM